MGKKYILRLLLLGCLAFVSNFSFAQESERQTFVDEDIKVDKSADEKENINKAVDLALLDSHFYGFFSDEEAGKHYGFHLPVIIVDDGIKIFSSAEFDFGNNIVEKDGNYYVYYRSKIYKTDASGELTFNEKGFPTNKKPLDLSITKNVFSSILIAILMILIFVSMAKTYKNNQLPKGFGRVLEPMIVFIRDDIAKNSIGPKYHKFTGFLLTIFFFILFLNLFGMMPFGTNVTGSITVTIALAMITFFVTQFSGNKNYWKHIFWFPDVHPIVKIILIPIELLGMITKPFSLMIRLFANMTAGQVMGMMFVGFIFIFRTWVAGTAFFGFSIFISILGLLVAFLKAYIFTLLSSLYIAAAVEEEHTSEEDTEELPIV